MTYMLLLSIQRGSCCHDSFIKYSIPLFDGFPKTQKKQCLYNSKIPFIKPILPGNLQFNAPKPFSFIEEFLLRGIPISKGNPINKGDPI